MKNKKPEMTLERIIQLKCQNLKKSKFLDARFEKKLSKEKNMIRLMIFANKYFFPGSNKLIERWFELAKEKAQKNKD